MATLETMGERKPMPVLADSQGYVGLREMDQASAIYLAGIVDGEGSISVNVSTHFSVSIMVSNTAPELMRWLYESIGGNYRRGSQKRATFVGTKPIYRWQISGRAATILIERIRPWLIIKAPQADAAMALQAALDTGQHDSAISHVRKIRFENDYGRRRI